MTIKEVETLTGITKANIRFYEKEGLLAPGRSSNNYREYSEDDVEHLRKIRIFRIMGFSVAQIHQLADHPQRAAVLMERGQDRYKRKLRSWSASDKCVWRSGIQGGGLIHWTRSCWK